MLAPVVVTMCKKCGRAVGEGDKKCTKCGARVKRRSHLVSDFIVLGVLLLFGVYYLKVGMDYRKRPACSKGASDLSYMSSAQIKHILPLMMSLPTLSRSWRVSVLAHGQKLN